MTTENKNTEAEEQAKATTEEAQTSEEQVTAENEEATVEEAATEGDSVETSADDELAKMKDQYLRLTAEYDNYRKRTLKEKMELTKSAGERILVNLLPVMDDFERALQNMDAADAASVKEGIDLIYAKFNDFLKQQGVTEIEAQDADFDTDHHEALTKIPAPTEEMKGKVVDVISKGYNLHDKVMRFAKVVVGE